MFFSSLLGRNSAQAYAYLADETYQLLSGLEGDTIEIASSRSSSLNANLLAFSPDGKYVYYLTKYDSSSGTGTLCRAQYRKLKEDSSKNSDYIEQIDTNVCPGFTFFDDGTFVYMDGSDNLYYYDGQEKVRIAKDVNWYDTDDYGRIIYETGNYSDGYKLSGTTTSDVSATNSLISSYSNFYIVGDFDHILCTKTNKEDETLALYEVGFGQSAQKIASGVTIRKSSGNAVYYTVVNGEELNLYDYVEDIYDDDSDYESLREALQNKDNNFSLKTLYCYSQGALTVISDEVLYVRNVGDALMYNTASMITETVDLDDVYTISDVTELFALDYEAENYLLSPEGTDPVQMSSDAAMTFADVDDDVGADLYVTDSYVYMEAGDGCLYAAEISGGVVDDFGILDDDAEVLICDEGVLYYLSGVYTDSSDYTYGNLYSSTDKGDQTLLAKDIIVDTAVYLYSDNVLLAYTDRNGTRGYELSMFAKDGERTTISDYTTWYVYAGDSKLLYISDGSLYYYDGKESTLLADDVDYAWAFNSAEITASLGYSEYYDW